MSARRVLAIVGTKGPFPRLVEALAEVARRTGWSIEVQHAGQALPAPLGGWSTVAREVLLERLAQADAVVCHAGSGTLRDALAAGHRPIVVPRLARRGEHVDDHQLDLAAALGARVLCLPELAGAPLADALQQAIATVERGAARELPGAALRAALEGELAAIAVRPLSRRARLIYAGAAALSRMARYSASRRAPRRSLS